MCVYAKKRSILCFKFNDKFYGEDELRVFFVCLCDTCVESKFEINELELNERYFTPFSMNFIEASSSR